MNLKNYSNQGFTSDLVKYGLRLWGREIVSVATCWGNLKESSNIEKSNSPVFTITRRPGYAYLDYIGLGSAMVSIRDCDPRDESSILSRGLQPYSVARSNTSGFEPDTTSSNLVRAMQSVSVDWSSIQDSESCDIGSNPIQTIRLTSLAGGKSE